MNKSVIFFVVLLLSILCYKLGLTYKREDMMEKNPGLGQTYMYFVDDDGKLIKIKLDFDNNTRKKMNSFYEKELLLEKDSSGGPVGKLLLLDAIPEENHAEKFDFYRDDITFTLFTRNYLKGINMKHFKFSKYDNTKLTKLVTHGFLSTGKSKACTTIKDNYLRQFDINVIVLDWGSIAADVLYPLPALQTGEVADYCAKFLAYLFKSIGVREEDTQLIGHSLGAHVVGFTGKRLIRANFKKVARITGLDPAGPMFTYVHISKQYAEFVDIIHTDAGWFGLNESIGDADFYPNGGDCCQPGCEEQGVLALESCSHTMSWKLYAQTILNANLYMAKCGKNQYVPMGSATPTTARGNCTLKT